MTAATQLTVEQFEALPDDVTARHELVEGELVEVSSSTLRNTLIRDHVLFLLKTWCLERQAAVAVCEMDVRTLPRTVRRPDVSIFSADQMRRFELDAVPVPEPPMIAVEVLSPSEAMIEVTRKAVEYLKAGSREVWLIDHVNREIHIRTAEVDRLLVEGKRLETDLLPGFSVAVGEIFASASPV